jgi:hypothetical protein
VITSMAVPISAAVTMNGSDVAWSSPATRAESTPSGRR